MTAERKIMTGTITGMDGRYRVVECPDAKPHLRILNIDPHRAKVGEVGDRVELEYFSTSTYGLWYITKVLAKDA